MAGKDYHINLRNIPDEMWRAFRADCVYNKMSLRDGFKLLLEQWYANRGADNAE